MEDRWLTIGRLVLILIVMPVCVALFFGAFAFKNLAPNAFRCSRCGREFTQKAWRSFPKRCPACRATDWNA
jgi:hypothetical protein